MKKTMEINGVNFEVKKKGSITFYVKNLFRNLTDCYTRPSDRKKAIWREWREFFTELDSYTGGCFVNSYNCNVFTIGNTIRFNGTLYNVLITPTHNYIAEV